MCVCVCVCVRIHTRTERHLHAGPRESRLHEPHQVCALRGLAEMLCRGFGELGLSHFGIWGRNGLRVYFAGILPSAKDVSNPESGKYIWS